jgi:hypothetical protein
LKLSNTQIRNNAKFGLSLYAGVTLAQFESNTITNNDAGAVRVEVQAVQKPVRYSSSSAEQVSTSAMEALGFPRSELQPRQSSFEVSTAPVGPE